MARTENPSFRKKSATFYATMTLPRFAWTRYMCAAPNLGRGAHWGTKKSKGAYGGLDISAKMILKVYRYFYGACSPYP